MALPPSMSPTWIRGGADWLTTHDPFPRLPLPRLYMNSCTRPLVLLYNPVVFLGYLHKWIKNTWPHKNLYTHIYSALFIITKTCKQPRYPSVGEWINFGTFIEWNIFQWLSKQMSCENMETCQMHIAYRLYNICFQLYDFMEKATL